MSITGYFKSILNTWENLEKRTPSAVGDMKEVIRQFKEAVRCDEIEKENLDELIKAFGEVYKEVYK